MKQHRTRIALAAGLLILIVIACAMLAVVTRPHERGRAVTDHFGLGGTDVTERDLSLAEQVMLLDRFAPTPTPESATAIRLHYQRFQDIFFEGSFTLAPSAYDAYVRQLQPLGPTVGVASAMGKYRGVIIGNYTSIIVPDPATYRITVSYTAG